MPNRHHSLTPPPSSVGAAQHKGTGLLHVIEALGAIPDARKHVQKDLWHYLDGQILPSGWYPERHYGLLLEALASALDPKAVGGNVWHFIGRTAAKRDLAGAPTAAPASNRPGGSGLYRAFVKEAASETSAFFLRAKKLWHLHHDTGEWELLRRVERDATVVLRLTGFRFAVESMEQMYEAYLLEFASLSGVDMASRLMMSPRRGDAHYEWDHTLTPSTQTAEWLQTLPEA
jgi:hypothetical protein